MNKEKIIVADASPLIAFGCIGSISVLTKTLGSVIVPETVANECLKDIARPGAQEIQKAIQMKLLELHPNIKIPKEIHSLLTVLDEGEAAAIGLALHLQSGLLIDEKLGRGTARKLNLPIIGTAGVLLLAKKKKNISAVKPLIERLKKSGYYLSKALVAEVLKLANE